MRNYFSDAYGVTTGGGIVLPAVFGKTIVLHGLVVQISPYATTPSGQGRLVIQDTLDVTQVDFNGAFVLNYTPTQETQIIPITFSSEAVRANGSGQPLMAAYEQVGGETVNITYWGEYV